MTTDIDASYGPASGPSATDCHALGYRTRHGAQLQADHGDSWLLEASGTQLTVVLGKAGWWTGIWRSTDGHTFVSDLAGLMHHGPAPRGEPWPMHAIPGALLGVFGIDATTVFAWGLRGRDDFMVRWDGAQWTEMPAPQGGIVAVHGVRHDLVFAVGERGLAARWDGARWHALAAATTENLTSVFVVGDDEIWACGHRGTLLRGSVAGWEPFLSRPGVAMTSVAKWGGAVWVATTGDDGLCRLVDDARPRLESVKKALVGGTIDVRGELLVSAPGFLASSADGVAFSGFAAGVFGELVSDAPRSWEADAGSRAPRPPAAVASAEPPVPSSPIALRTADAEVEARDLAPIPDAVRALFGPRANMSADGEYVLGFRKVESGYEFARHHAGELVRSEVVVAIPCQPALEPATLDALVVDGYHRVLWRIAPDGRSRRLGQAPRELPATDLRVLADGTCAVIASDGTVAFYALDGDRPLRPLVRVSTGLDLLEASAVPGTMVLVCTDGNHTLVVLGVRRDGDVVEVRQLVRVDALTVPLPWLLLDEDGLTVRMPRRAALLESGWVKELDGVVEAMAAFERWPLLPAVPAPALS